MFTLAPPKAEQNNENNDNNNNWSADEDENLDQELAEFFDVVGMGMDIGRGIADAVDSGLFAGAKGSTETPAPGHSLPSHQYLSLTAHLLHTAAAQAMPTDSQLPTD